jgi:hypothetical protein
MKDISMELVDAMERLIESVERLAAGEEDRVAKITATVDSEREAELSRRLEEAEAKIAELAAAAAHAGRKTVAAGVAATVAKHGLSLEHVDAGALDTALNGLSIEQRIAVKAELLRAGLVS